jgi:DNA invertase Pin-like site-specific DNA recombinase
MPVPPGIRVDLTPQGVVMSGLVIGYARVSTEEQDLTAQRDGLATLGVDPSRIYVDHGLTGTNRERPGLREALAACRAGDTLVVTKLDRLARSLPDARAIAEDLTKRKVRLSPGASVYDPTDPVGRLLFNVLAMVAEFEADLIRSRTREGMRVAKAKGHLRGKQPKLNPRQEAHLVELLHSGQYSTAEIGDLFGVARSTVYRAVARSKTAATTRRTAATAPATPAIRKVLVRDDAGSSATDTYRPRHGAPSELPSKNGKRSRVRTVRPDSAPQMGR